MTEKPPRKQLAKLTVVGKGRKPSVRKVTKEMVDKVHGGSGGTPSTRNPKVGPQGGRPPYEPTKEGSAFVRYGMMTGLTQQEMADHLDISVMTLQKYYGREVRKSRLEILSLVSQARLQVALDTNHRSWEKANTFVHIYYFGFAPAKATEESDEALTDFSIDIGDKRGA